MADPDPFDLQRFVTAQAAAFPAALEELQAGRKRSHWMWFVFPQLRGLGRSATAQTYGVGSLEEARAYLAHPLLGPRLDLCTRTVLRHGTRALREIFGSPDDVKFLSCMSLFRLAAGEASPYQHALDRWDAGRLDPRTVALLRGPAHRR